MNQHLIKDPDLWYILCPWCDTIQETEMGKDWENYPTRVISRHHGRHMDGACADQPEAWYGKEPTEWDWFVAGWGAVGAYAYFYPRIDA